MKIGPKVIIALSAAVTVVAGLNRPAQAEQVGNGWYFYVQQCPSDMFTACTNDISDNGCGWDGTGEACFASTSGPAPYVLFCWNVEC